MAQHDYDINSADAISGLQFRQDLNACLAAIKSSNSGATAPTVTAAGMLWLDTSTNPAVLKMRDQSNLAWLPLGGEDTIGTPVASAITTNIGALEQGDTLVITGTTTINSFGASVTGVRRTLIFNNTLTITNNNTSLILPLGQNLTVVAGDVIEVICTDGLLGYWVAINLSLASPIALTQAVTDSSTKVATTAFATPRTGVNGVTILPDGTTAQRPTLAVGQRGIRFNTDINSYEGWDGTAWGSLGGGATGGGSDHVFNNNEYLVTTNYTIPTGKSSVSVGDSNGNISFNSGVTVTLNTGSRWVIL